MDRSPCSSRSIIVRPSASAFMPPSRARGLRLWSRSAKGCAERLIRTLKENLLWLTTVDTVEELRVALLEFQHRYNEAWLIGRHGYKTPMQVRQEQMAAL